MSLPIASRARIYWQNLTRVLNSGNTGKHGPEPFGMRGSAVQTLPSATGNHCRAKQVWMY